MMYYKTKLKIFSGLALDLLNDDIRVALLTQAYGVDLAVDEFFDDISTNESVFTGYTAGGELLVNKSLTLNGKILTFDADDVVWAVTGTASAYQAVIYKDTGDPATSPLLFHKPFLKLRTIINKPFTLEWASEGIFAMP